MTYYQSSKKSSSILGTDDDRGFNGRIWKKRPQVCEYKIRSLNLYLRQNERIRLRKSNQLNRTGTQDEIQNAEVTMEALPDGMNK